MNRNSLMILVLGLYSMSCSEIRTPTIQSPTNSIDIGLSVPETMVDKSELLYDTKKSLWTLNDQLYSGYAVSFYQDSTLKEKFGILEGRRESLAIDWYPDGHYKYVTNYHKGKPHGDKKAWSPDSSHTLLSHYKYISGKPHGEQLKWYPTGQLFKKLNLSKGKEQGLQRAWRKNGKLYVNYEARNGRIFGLKRANLCYELSGENIVSNN